MILSTLILPKSGIIKSNSYPYLKIQTTNDLIIKFECLDGNLCLPVPKDFLKYLYRQNKDEYWIDLKTMLKTEGWLEPCFEKILIERARDNTYPYYATYEKLNLMKVMVKGEECNNTYYIDLKDKENAVLLRMRVDNINEPKEEGYKVRVTLE